MPHLAPLSWAIAPLLFILLLMMTITTLWWSPSISHPSASSSQPSPSSFWDWKYASKYMYCTFVFQTKSF